MSARNGDVREHVIRDLRLEVRGMAREGMSEHQIDQAVNGHRDLSDTEQDLVYYLIHHAVAEVRGRY